MFLRTFLKQVLPDNAIATLNSAYGSLQALFKMHDKKTWVLKYEPTYNEDGLYTNHNCDFMKDPLFKEAYDLGFATNSTNQWHLHWRVYVACWLANRSKNMEGDFVECGTNRGMISRAVIHYTDFGKLTKNFYLMDTFCGLTDKYQSETEMQRDYIPKYDECYQAVERTFGEFKNVILVRGMIPDTLPIVQTKKVSYLHIDMNCVAPEIAAGEYFWDKLVSSAGVLLDDYAYPGFYDQKIAWDDFAKQRGVEVLSLPTGQGLILKP